MVNRRHAVGRREVQRKNQSQDDTGKKKEKSQSDKRGESEVEMVGAVVRHGGGGGGQKWEEQRRRAGSEGGAWMYRMKKEALKTERRRDGQGAAE